MTSVLFVVSAADSWTLKDGSSHPTGYWAEELATPHSLFRDAGWDITVATPGGVPPTVDQASLGEDAGSEEELARIKEYLDSIEAELGAPIPLEDIDDTQYDLVFYPGGHGPMEDLAHDPTSGALLSRRVTAGEPVALLCHAPAAVLAAVDADGSNVFAGRTMTAFSDDEERAGGLAEQAKWLVESEMVAAGITYEKADEPMAPKVVVDGSIYSGQNPASSELLAQTLIEDLDS
ncbi:MAG: type 1 glutamine amidotransferase domain-containing protein [Micrococcus sp.]|nr:type 1 glutamine amidotransferase domain-containing protein [Micrococcus sp.]